MKVPKINWIPFDNKNPPTDLNGDSDYLILLREDDYDEGKTWRYSVDVASPYGNYIDSFWDTANDWCEGQRVEVVAYAELPYYLKESDLFEIEETLKRPNTEIENGEEFTCKITMEAMETEDLFIFRTIQPFCERITERKISKKELEDALQRQRKVDFTDDDHVWIDGNQFVSLRRYFESRESLLKEFKMLNEKFDEIKAENEALKTLLKESL